MREVEYEITKDEYEFGISSADNAYELMLKISREDGYDPAGYSMCDPVCYIEGGMYCLKFKRSQSCD